MTSRFKLFLVGALLVSGLHFISNKRDHNARALMQQDAAQIQAQFPRPVPRIRSTSRRPISYNAQQDRFQPIRSLHSLSNRGCQDDDLSSLILQNEMIKKDPRLAWHSQDIDDFNHLLLAYVERGVRENKSYFLRRKLVETFGQTNHTVLINRLRLVAVLLGGEKGRGGMDPTFTPIREEAHRISPYVMVLVQDYIDKLEAGMKRSRIDFHVDEKFKKFVNTLGDSFQSEYGIASIGKKNRNQPAKELFAMKVLLRDLKEYYGERVEREGSQLYEVIFANSRNFKSARLTDLKRQYRSMSSMDLANCFIDVGLELREHLSEVREKRGASAWGGGEEEINELKRLNEIAATVTGLFAAGRVKIEALTQAETLVDLLFLEGLYSKKERKALKQELAVQPALGAGHERETRAFYSFLNYMNGLAYAAMDEGLGDAARAYARLTKEAENYLEVQARKSALQVLGQLQQEFYQKHRTILGGKTDIHLAGKAQGELRVFRSESEISAFLRKDSLNGEGTIWVLKSGLNMPNEASFAAIILEDPIMKASHYDGYARSKKPPIPLMQIPGAAESYAKHHGKQVLLEAMRDPFEKVAISQTNSRKVQSANTVTKRRQLDQATGQATLHDISASRSNNELRAMQKQVGSKAANYAFLRSALPLDQSKQIEHIYPGFAISFQFYQRHLESSGAQAAVARLATSQGSGQVRDTLEMIRSMILDAPIESELLDLFRLQMEETLRAHQNDDVHPIKLRFRSSSNAEDNKDFSGAGLYESHFAFYAFGRGNSSQNTHHISMAIKKVWASLWKAEAYLARERVGIIQDSVQMSILVHPSYRKEESTGVVFYYAPDDIEIVANHGNENVQNPSIAGLTPEVHQITTEHKVSYSSKFALSEKAVLSAKDRKQLMALLEGVIPKFQALYPDQDVSAVDIEFKILEVPKGKDGKKTDVVMLKQIRPLAKRVAME